jgi:hypothetical protein
MEATMRIDRWVGAVLAGLVLTATACGGNGEGGGGGGSTYDSSRALADAIGCEDFKQNGPDSGDSGTCAAWGGTQHGAEGLLLLMVEAEPGWDLAAWRQTQIDLANGMMRAGSDCVVLVLGENWVIWVGTCDAGSHDAILEYGNLLHDEVGGSLNDFVA